MILIATYECNRAYPLQDITFIYMKCWFDFEQKLDKYSSTLFNIHSPSFKRITKEMNQ